MRSYPRDVFFVHIAAFNGFNTNEFSGIGIVGYFTASALCMETVFEVMPCLFDAEHFALGWSFTVVAWVGSDFTRTILKYAVSAGKQSVTAERDYPLVRET